MNNKNNLMKSLNMKNTTKNLYPTLLLILICLITACTDSSNQNQGTVNEKSQVSEKAAAEPMVEPVASDNEPGDGFESPLVFNLKNLEGQAVQADDFKGKWLVINYWATWCAPCRDEIPELVKFQAENADTVQVVGIAYEDASIEKLQSFAKDFNVNYPLLTIDVYNPPEFAREGGLGLPTTIVYNTEGMRHKKHMGPIDAVGLQEMLQ